jgi:hypothetical protein
MISECRNLWARAEEKTTARSTIRMDTTPLGSPSRTVSNQIPYAE